ncbi:MFS transporter [Nesterenkonia alba]|uniref:MFS transporter n=1 Tax=Nesterenkonia alba TaxID=515814 RepID=UPI0003B3FF2A|nr:MFS transporter [Nesterenkonia alba]
MSQKTDRVPDYEEATSSPIGPMTSPIQVLSGSIPVVTGTMRAVSADHQQPQYSPRQVAVAILALSLGGFAIGVTEFAIMGLQREAVQELALTSYSEGGLLITFYAAGVVIGAPILSLMGAKRERKTYGLFLLGIFAFAHVFSYFAPTFEALLFGRFLSGLPHGAYFATAALMAAQMAGPTKRARAIAVVLSGIAIANLMGVPAVTWAGQQFGWRLMFLITAVLAIITMVAVAYCAPRMQPPEGSSIRGELKGLANQRLWVGIALVIVGFSGMFAIYSYISHIAVDVAGIGERWLWFVVLMFGLGNVIGNFAGGWFSDKSVLGTVLVATVLVATFMTLFGLLAQLGPVMVVLLFLIGAAAGALGPAMQTHLIDTAPRAPQLAASFQHSAFNSANAIGAILGGVVIDAGFGLRAPAYAGAIAAGLGIAICLYAIWLTKRRGLPV